MNRESAILEKPKRLSEELAERVSGATVIRRDEPLAKRTTLRVGGPADLYIEPASEPDLAAVLRFCKGHKLAWFVLGRGSNLLVKDGGFRGAVAYTEEMAQITVARNPKWGIPALEFAGVPTGIDVRRVAESGIAAPAGGLYDSPLDSLERIPEPSDACLIEPAPRPASLLH